MIYTNMVKIKVSSDISILQAMRKIDENRLRFVIVVDNNDYVLGILTDGDVRRQLINGASLQTRISINKTFNFLDFEDDFSKVCELFRSSRLDFLPILKSGKLFNVITKKQFDKMLIEGITYKPDINFSKFNFLENEQEIHNKPWGFYKSVWLNSNAQAKILSINPGAELSFQKHMRREEHWIVTKGDGLARLEKQFIKLHPGKYLHIPKKSKHQIINNSDKQLFISEVQLGDYFGEDDIFRYSDKYGRENKIKTVS